MALPQVFSGNVRIDGNLSVSSFSPPAACIGDAAMNVSSPIGVDKQVHQYVQKGYEASGAAAQSKTWPLHIARAAGNVIGFRCALVVANVGAATVTFMLKKNGSNILTGTVDFDSGDAAYAVLTGTLSSAAYNAGDVFTVTVVATAGGGTIGQGPIWQAEFEEAQS